MAFRDVGEWGAGEKVAPQVRAVAQVLTALRKTALESLDEFMALGEEDSARLRLERWVEPLQDYAAALHPLLPLDLHTVEHMPLGRAGRTSKQMSYQYHTLVAEFANVMLLAATTADRVASAADKSTARDRVTKALALSATLVGIAQRELKQAFGGNLVRLRSRLEQGGFVGGLESFGHIEQLQQLRFNALTQFDTGLDVIALCSRPQAVQELSQLHKQISACHDLFVYDDASEMVDWCEKESKRLTARIALAGAIVAVAKTESPEATVNDRKLAVSLLQRTHSCATLGDAGSAYCRNTIKSIIDRAWDEHHEHLDVPDVGSLAPVPSTSITISDTWLTEPHALLQGSKLYFNSQWQRFIEHHRATGIFGWTNEVAPAATAPAAASSTQDATQFNTTQALIGLGRLLERRDWERATKSVALPQTDEALAEIQKSLYQSGLNVLPYMQVGTGGAHEMQSSSVLLAWSVGSEVATEAKVPDRRSPLKRALDHKLRFAAGEANRGQNPPAEAKPSLLARFKTLVTGVDPLVTDLGVEHPTTEWLQARRCTFAHVYPWGSDGRPDAMLRYLVETGAIQYRVQLADVLGATPEQCAAVAALVEKLPERKPVPIDEMKPGPLRVIRRILEERDPDPNWEQMEQEGIPLWFEGWLERPFDAAMMADLVHGRLINLETWVPAQHALPGMARHWLAHYSADEWHSIGVTARQLLAWNITSYEIKTDLKNAWDTRRALELFDSKRKG